LAVATATPESVHASRALHWAVPSGSIYLLDFGDEAAASRWAKRHHGEAYGRPRHDRLRTAGFGVILTGAWK
jgi:CRISPR-associated protein Cmr3